MKQYKTTTGDDISMQFFQSTNNKNRSVYKYATKKELVMEKKHSSASTQTRSVCDDEPGPSTDDSVNMSSSTPSTPSAKRQKGTPNDRNICKKCKLVYNSKMDDDYDSLWINCAHRGCDWWVHMYCMGIDVRENNIQDFESIVKVYCQSHNPHPLPRPSSKRKL